MIATEWLVFIPLQKKGNAKEYSNYHSVAIISHASKVMCKMFQARFQQHVNQEHLHVEAGFRKGRGTRNQIAIYQIIQKSRDSRKTSASASLTMLKSLNVRITTNWKIFQEMAIPD